MPCVGSAYTYKQAGIFWSTGNIKQKGNSIKNDIILPIEVVKVICHRRGLEMKHIRSALSSTIQQRQTHTRDVTTKQQTVNLAHQQTTWFLIWVLCTNDETKTEKEREREWERRRNTVSSGLKVAMGAVWPTAYTYSDGESEETR